MKWYAVIAFSVLHTVCGVLSVKAFAFLETGDAGNMSLFGGVFFMPVLYFISADVRSGQLHRLWMLRWLSHTGNARSLPHKGTRDPLLYCDADSAHPQSEKEQEPRQYLPTLYGILWSVPLH